MTSDTDKGRNTVKRKIDIWKNSDRDQPDATQEENVTEKLSVDPESGEDGETLPRYSGSSKDSGSRVTIWDNVSTPKPPADKTKLKVPGCSTKDSTTKSKKKKKCGHLEDESSSALRCGGDTSSISQTLDFQNRSYTDLDYTCDCEMDGDDAYGDNDTMVMGK